MTFAYSDIAVPERAERTLSTFAVYIPPPPLTSGEIYDMIERHAGMAELADAPDLGSGGQPCRFDPCYPYHGKTPLKSKPLKVWMPMVFLL